MYRYFLKTKFVFLVALALTVFFPCRIAHADSGQEMQILHMFYKEKDLVVSATRHPKPVSQVAENISIITAKEIEEMNAHTVADVLNRIPGLFINFNRDFGASSLIQTQGSGTGRHMLVMIDGISWNFLSNGTAETHSIPVGIIKRIEVIKGPASSSWGSSLGGVINIITKQVGTQRMPKGSVSASFGEEQTQDYRTEISGKINDIGYYLFAGRQDSDGLRSQRYFDTHSFYSKFNAPLSEKIKIGLTAGYSDPETGIGDFPSAAMSSYGLSRTFFTTAFLDISLNSKLAINVSLRHFKQKAVITDECLGSKPLRREGELFSNSIFDEKTTGGSAKLVWKHGMHTVVSGMDMDHGKLDQTINSGRFLQFMRVPATSVSNPDIEKWAIYANDTITVGRWTIIPGIRYDHNDITGSFVSPSLGVTCRLGKDSIIRASVARGFTIPPLSWMSGGALFLEPNESLDSEEVWSYQAGVESSALKYFWVKATIFRHELEEALAFDMYGAGPPKYNDICVNGGSIRRQGFELEVETLSFYNAALFAGYAFVDLKPADARGADKIHSYDIGIRYDDGDSFSGLLLGRYVWWDLDSASGAKYNDFIWDLNLNKKILNKKNITTELFCSIHNLFNASQYTFFDSKNPERWAEAGIRFKF